MTELSEYQLTPAGQAALRARSPYKLVPVPEAIASVAADEWMLLVSGVELMRGGKGEMLLAYRRCVNLWLRSQTGESPS